MFLTSESGSSTIEWVLVTAITLVLLAGAWVIAEDSADFAINFINDSL